MKTLIVLACVALACSWPMKRKGDGPKPTGDPMQPKMPEGPVEPLTVGDLMGLMSDVQDFASEARGHFDRLQADADAIDGSEADLAELGEKTMNMVEELEEMGGERAQKLGEQWMQKMMRLVIAGVEDEGQCHKVLEHLMSYLDDAERKRQMSEGEREFWNGVVEAAKEEVACIIGRFHEFEGMLSHVQDAINNPPAGYDEDGHAFEAEVLMGSIVFGFSHMYRQVAVFTGVMRGLAEHEKSEAGERSLGQLRTLLREAEKLQDRMDQMKSLRKMGQKALF